LTGTVAPIGLAGRHDGIVKVPGRLVERLGPLQERDYRLLFGATVTTSFGSAVGLIALAFAVLDVAGATSLGLVIAARQVASAAVLLLGGVLSDRARRNLVLAGAALLQGTAQAAIAAAVLTGSATVPFFVLTAVLWGVGDGLVVPAETGLVPQTVSQERLQQANALQGLSRSGVRVIGPAIGGVITVAAGPGWALALDAVSYFLCAAFLGRIRVIGRLAQPEPFLAELRAGFREFTSRTWLWSTVLLFGIGNAFHVFLQVLGPLVAKDRLGGAGAWAAIVTAAGVGSIAGGVLALRYRPVRTLVASITWSLAVVFEFAALAVGAATWVIALGAFAGGVGVAVHVALWFTVFQREVPQDAQSRVSSYDAFGSFVLNPLGAAVVGPLAAAVGVSGALWIAVAAMLATSAAMLCIPSVWSIRAGGQRSALPAA
jgi:MFS family permease